MLGHSSALLVAQGTYTLQGWLPTETRTSFLEPVARFVPVMVSVVPPAWGPLSGLIPEGWGSCREKMVKLIKKMKTTFTPVLNAIIAN